MLQLLKTKHRKVSILEYEKYPGMYESPLCVLHQAHQITDVCVKCNELLCSRSDPKGFCRGTGEKILSISDRIEWALWHSVASKGHVN